MSEDTTYRICRDCAHCAWYNKRGLSSPGRKVDTWDCHDPKKLPVWTCPVTGHVSWPKCHALNQDGGCKAYKEPDKPKKLPWWRNVFAIID